MTRRKIVNLREDLLLANFLKSRYQLIVWIKTFSKTEHNQLPDQSPTQF